MPAVVIVGAQWGDEGKGKITDYLARGADTVVRYQGGNNAGHTIVVGDSTYKFHLIPSGMLHQDKICVLGNGVVIDPQKLLEELDALSASGTDIERLKISDQAHYILPTHKWLDEMSEAKKGEQKIGTTGRGIGPAYQDKVNRCGVRVGDPASPEALKQRVAQHFQEHNVQHPEWTQERVVDFLLAAYARLKPHICNTSALLNNRLDRGGRVLLEGAQGTLLDVDHGTYPFVTSSSPTSGGACIGAGIGPTRIDRVLGVTKAYSTRVGSGPFPTELFDEAGKKLQQRGSEFGTTTGRTRRCGWLDLVALRYAVQINGMTHLALTKLDVLDTLEEIKICTAYRVGDEILNEYPTDANLLPRVEPVFETVKGWQASTEKARTWADLPSRAMAYVSRIEDVLRVPVAIVSVGADRMATFSRLAIWEGI
jgi:adenylosuccinate synthase